MVSSRAPGKPQRLSLLSKLNLLGLVSLAEIALRFRIGQVTLQETIAACRLAIQDLKDLLTQHANSSLCNVGIASQNIIEDYMRHLEGQQKVLDLKSGKNKKSE